MDELTQPVYREWEKIMQPQVLEARYGLSPEMAKTLAEDISKSFQAGMNDLEGLLRERDEELDALRSNEHDPRKYA